MASRSALDHLLFGTVVAGFRIVRVLGEGGMGVVYLARQLSLDREVALKVLRPRLLAQADERARFLQEGVLASRITHSRLVPLVDVGEAGGLLYLAYELIEGPTLRSRLTKSGPLGPGPAVEVGVACAEALERLHGQGVLHRDLKAENIFFSAGLLMASAIIALLAGATKCEGIGGERRSRHSTVPSKTALACSRLGAKSPLYLREMWKSTSFRALAERAARPSTTRRCWFERGRAPASSSPSRRAHPSRATRMHW